MGEWEENEAERRARRRAARCSNGTSKDTLSFYMERNQTVNFSPERFGSNVTTSSVSSIRTKNTFLDVQDETERLEVHRMRSSRSRSLPPALAPQLEEQQLWIASFLLEQLVNLQTPECVPALVVPKRKPAITEEQKRGRLFVGGLCTSSTDEALRNHFAKYGDLVEANIILDKRSKHSRGFGFVAFRDGFIPPHVLTDEHNIDGKIAGVRLYASEPDKNKN